MTQDASSSAATPTFPTASSSAPVRFTLVVHNSGQAARLAQRFVNEALNGEHHIEQVFFYHDGVFEADDNRAPAQDDPALAEDWQTLSTLGNFPLNICIAAAARRGVHNPDEASRHQKPSANLAAPFELVGLGVFVEGLINADRVITFGN